MREVHKPSQVPCPVCSKVFISKNRLRSHMRCHDGKLCIVGWFKRSLNQSIGSFSCNAHFALLRSDERSDILGNVSNHWGMVTYNFFRNNFFGSLIRTWSGAEFVMRHTHFRILRPLDLLLGSRSYYQMLPFLRN